MCCDNIRLDRNIQRGTILRQNRQGLGRNWHHTFYPHLIATYVIKLRFGFELCTEFHLRKLHVEYIFRISYIFLLFIGSYSALPNLIINSVEESSQGGAWIYSVFLHGYSWNSKLFVSCRKDPTILWRIFRKVIKMEKMMGLQSSNTEVNYFASWLVVYK